MTRALFALIIFMASVSSAHASAFYVVNLTAIKKETRFNVGSEEELEFREKKKLAEQYRQTLTQVTLPKDIQIRVVEYDYCSGRICGELLPVAGKFNDHDSATEFCGYLSKRKIPCEVTKVFKPDTSRKSPSDWNSELAYYSICHSVKEWCLEERH